MLLRAGVVWSSLRQTDFAELELWTSLRPTDSGIIDGVAVLSQLNNDAKLNGLLRYALLEFVEEEIWSLRGRCRVIEIFVSRHRQHSIPPVAAYAVRVGEPESRYREKRLLPKARRNRLGSLHKRQSRRMLAKELLNGVRVRPSPIGGNQRIEKLQESFRSARGEGVDRMSDDVRMNMLGKVEADRAS